MLIQPRLGALVLSLLLTASGRGDFIVTISDTQFAPGSTAFVDVTIASTGSNQLAQFGFEFRITTSGSTRLEFVDPQPDPQLGSASYVFAGNSLDAGPPATPVGTVGTNTVPNDNFVGGDATADGNDVTVTSSRLLARLQVTANTSLPPVAGDTFTISLITGPNTFFQDSSFNDIPYTSNPGTETASPEPGSFMLASVAGMVLASYAARRRARASTPRQEETIT